MGGDPSPTSAAFRFRGPSPWFGPVPVGFVVSTGIFLYFNFLLKLRNKFGQLFFKNRVIFNRTVDMTYEEVTHHVH
jgi:hypothetical protein